jgi:hypothetical protein
LQKEGRIVAGSVLPPEPGATFHRLKIEGQSQGLTATVLAIDRPQIAGPRYALTGQVRYEAVEGTGYLELWNHFPGGGQYFSRTLGDAGPMMKLHGTSGWREFTLPFDATGAPPPVRLVFNVVLPGRGVVYLGPLKLADSSNGNEAASSWGWVPDRTAVLAGAIGGAVIGSLGALLGVFTSLGRARRFVVATATALALFGVLAFIAGIVALTESQPYAVYYPLLLGGFLSAIVPLGLMPAIRKRYEEIELRAMRAQDLG